MESLKISTKNCSEIREELRLSSDGRIPLRGNAMRLRRALASLDSACIEAHQIARDVDFVQRDNEQDDEALHRFRLEKLPGKDILKFTFPYLGYRKVVYNRAQFPNYPGYYTHWMVGALTEDYLKNEEGKDILSQAPLLFFEDPFLYFLSHFSGKRQRIDSDNMETKHFIDSVDCRFFSGDDAQHLFTAYAGVSDKDDFTEVFLCDKKDAVAVFEIVHNAYLEAQDAKTRIG
jgi:hypothetical protein